MPVDPKHPRRGSFRVPVKGTPTNEAANRANEKKADAKATPLKAIRGAQKNLHKNDKLSDRQVRKKKN